MIPYTKYHSYGDVHWQWYNTEGHNYKKFVDGSLAPFKDVTPGTIVDIGSGDGLPLSILRDLGFKCYGVEPMQEGIDQAMKHNVKAEYFVEVAEKFAERNLEFDYLYSLNTIEHMDNPACMIEIMKKIKNFGVIVTDNAENTTKLSPFHTVNFSPATFEALFKDFDVQRIDVGHPCFMGYIIKNKTNL